MRDWIPCFIYYEEKNVSKGTRVVVKLVSFSQFALKTKMIVPSSGQFENVCFWFFFSFFIQLKRIKVEITPLLFVLRPLQEQGKKQIFTFLLPFKTKNALPTYQKFLELLNVSNFNNNQSADGWFFSDIFTDLYCESIYLTSQKFFQCKF